MMKGQRTERLIRIASRFLSCPSRQLSLTSLAGLFNVSKTVISDDVAIIGDALANEGLGNVSVGRGRSGGASFIPQLSSEKQSDLLKTIAECLSQEDRVLPGGLIYYTDILFNPQFAWQLGFVLASDFRDSTVDIVMTSEVKGIPLGMATAHALGVPLAVCRFRNRPSDGPAVCVHYPTQTGDVRAMYMGTKSLPRGSKVLIIDDFMRGGSTAAGMSLVAREFGAQIVEIGVFMVSSEPEKKAVKNYKALLSLDLSDTGMPQIQIC